MIIHVLYILKIYCQVVGINFALNYFNCFLVTITFYYTIFDKILKIFLCIFDIFKRARSVPLVHSTKNQMLYHAITES